MSALLTHAKAMRALGDGLATESSICRDKGDAVLLAHLSVAHHKAATALEEQARAEASPPETCAGCGGASPAPGKRCAVCQRLKA